jgi:nucleoside 2-deoxyribosyltransferase
MIKESAVTMALITGRDPDPKQAVELGYMILLDKPIIAVVTPGAKVPNKLAICADAIVEANLDDSKDTAIRIKEAIDSLDLPGINPLFKK